MPCRVLLLNDGQLLFSTPAFDLLFAEDGLVDVLKCLESHQARAAVGFAETVEGAVFVLLNSPEQIVCHTAVEDASAACHEVDVKVALGHLA